MIGGDDDRRRRAGMAQQALVVRMIAGVGRRRLLPVARLLGRSRRADRAVDAERTAGALRHEKGERRADACLYRDRKEGDHGDHIGRRVRSQGSESDASRAQHAPFVVA